MQIILKRIMDIVISTCGLLLTGPVFLAVSIVIKLSSPGPVFFTQERAGLHGDLFMIYKFRSMVAGAEKNTLGRYVDKDFPSITGIGKFLRRWALDELPQLWNVLKGDMSIVGPRPAMPYQIEKYDERQRKRLDAKPGLTGWAQVNGRNKLTWPERIEYDLWYVDNWSILLDLRILAMTFPALIKKEFAFASTDLAEDEIVKFNNSQD